MTRRAENSVGWPEPMAVSWLSSPNLSEHVIPIVGGGAATAFRGHERQGLRYAGTAI